MNHKPLMRDSKIQILPCLIIGYARVEGVLNLIASAASAGVPRIYVSLDGPTNGEVMLSQKDLLERIIELRESDNIFVTVKVGQENQGVAVGVISAIEWFFSNEVEGIILEDDLEVKNDFFRFCTLGVHKYRDDQRIWMICGSQYFPNLAGDSVIWTSIPQIWGWASTKEKWVEMREAVWGLNRQSLITCSLNPTQSFWSTGARRALQGIIDTWDLPLVFSFFRHNKYAIIPPVNLVRNRGFDTFASNTLENKFPLGQEISEFGETLVWEDSVVASKTQSFENNLYSTVYKITFRHYLSSMTSLLFDWIRFPKARRKSPLVQRWKGLF
jgi:hypothetical protein